MTGQVNPEFPYPTFASVRVEFADGTFREFHIHKPVRTEVEITTPLDMEPLTADLGALPVALLPPTLTEVKILMKAAHDRRGAVMSIDSRRPDARTDRALALQLLSEAAELREMYGNGDGVDDLWHAWDRKVSTYLRQADLL